MTKNQGQTIMEFKSEVAELGRFLQEELTVSAAEIALVWEKQKQLNAPIPMLLWQYGLVSQSELERIYDWLETRS